MKIGYDFDGVLTMNVGPIDINGERHATKDLIIFELIKNKIISELKLNYQIYIISRNKPPNVIPLLEKYFPEIYNKIPKGNIILGLGDLNVAKSQIVYDLGLDAFYDDSPLNLHQINRLLKQDIIKTNLFLVNPDTSSYEKIHKNNYKILTYNVCWENMKGRRNKRGVIHNEGCLEPNLCASNISEFIQNELPLDFILLQEAANIGTLLSTLPDVYKIILYKSGLETILTIVNNSYKIIVSFGGEFERGRPFLCTFLSNICLINVHMGHKKKFRYDMKIIEHFLLDRKYSYKQFESYRIIIGGDFNQELDSEYEFMGKKIYKNTSTSSYGLKTKHNSKPIEMLNNFIMKDIDHIFDSDNNIVYSINLTPIDAKKRILPASDHVAIYAELQR